MAEWLAFINIEGLGNEETENIRAGQLCATIANFSGKTVKDTLHSSDFFPSLKGDVEPDKPVLLADKDAQSNLIMSSIFGTTMAKAYKRK